MNIIDIANEYLPYPLKEKHDGVYIVDTPSSHLSSLVFWVKDNRYYRFSTRTGGGPEHLLEHVVGLDENDINDIQLSDVSSSLLCSLLSESNSKSKDSGYSFSDITGNREYTKYFLGRNVNKDTFSYYNLESNYNNAIIPLTNIKGNRIGSLLRKYKEIDKNDRYTYKMIGRNIRPPLWPFHHLNKLTPSTVITLVEGAWSVCRIYEVICQKVLNILPLATLGTNYNNKVLDYIYEYDILVLLDADDTGSNEVLKQVERWQKKEVNVEVYQPNKGIDDMSDQELKSLFNYINRETSFQLTI